MTSRTTIGAVATLACMSFGCADVSDSGVGKQQSELRVCEQETADAWKLKTRVELAGLPAGVAASQHMFFVGSPLEGRVLAFRSNNGAAAGELPPPPNGFILPFIMHVVGPDRLIVLDAGGLPQPSPPVPVHPVLYEYAFTAGPNGAFSASLLRSWESNATDVGFPEDFVLLDDGRILLTDAVFGQIWLIESDGSFTQAIGPESAEPSAQIPSLQLCPDMPLVTVNSIPFLFSGSTIPGVSGIAVRGEDVYFSSPCARGVFKFPLSILDDERAPHERASDIELVATTPAEIEVEELLSIAFDPYDAADTHLYAAQPMQLQVLRIDTDTGERESLAYSPSLLDFPSSIAFAPPPPSEANHKHILVVSNQQERTPLTNDAISEDLLNPPFLVTELSFAGGPH